MTTTWIVVAAVTFVVINTIRVQTMNNILHEHKPFFYQIYHHSYDKTQATKSNVQTVHADISNKYSHSQHIVAAAKQRHQNGNIFMPFHYKRQRERETEKKASRHADNRIGASKINL